jgi:maltooligosyltrehalose trehalohydrolase
LTPSIAETARRGWLHGSDAAGVAYSSFVYCIQNHDQIGNRAFGDRLHHNIDAATYRAASALLLLLPQTPLLFMGQEWASSTPFRYFTDHNPVLGALVTEGRRREFGAFSAFADIVIPDPQAEESFVASRLKWDELTAEPHASMLRFYKSLLRLRREEKALHTSGFVPELQIEAVDGDTLRLQRDSLLALVCLHGHGEVELSGTALGSAIWSSEDPLHAPDSQPIEVNAGESLVRFARPGAIVFRMADKRKA